MKRQLFKDREHLVRAAGLFIGGLVVFLILQALLVPKGFGLYGHFRAGALDDNTARPLRFAGHAACEECHADAAAAKSAGKHARVSCEACHWALGAHAANPDSLVPQKPEPKTLCVRCHTANVAKPAGFPQIDPDAHGDKEVCTTCHVAHNPGAAPETSP